MYLILLFLFSFGYIAADNRIIGGNYASKGQFPHQISLQMNGRHHCGGSIISKNSILTAAHCTIGQTPSAMTVIAGTIDLLVKDGIAVQVSKFIIHPQYSKQSNDYDIAVVILEHSLHFTDDIKTIALSEPNENFDADTIGITSGWGAINENLQLSNRMKFAKIQLWSRDYCNAKNIPGITDRMICAGHPSGQVSSCQGDSGGPLTVLTNDKLIGVVSWGFGCGVPGRPTIFTFVGTFKSWISQTIEI